MIKITLIGNMTRDPELRSVPSANGPINVCNFGLAVNSRRKNANGERDTVFFNCTAWRTQAEIIARYTHKGNKLCVIGSDINMRTFVGNDGQQRTSLEVQVEDFEFLTTRNDSTGAAPGMYSAAPVAGQAAPAAPAPTAQNNGFTAVDSDELPF